MDGKIDLIVELRPGRPRDAEIQYATLGAMKELKIATCEEVRRYTGRILGRSVSWNTVKKCLEEFVNSKAIKKQILRRRKRESSVYRTI